MWIIIPIRATIRAIRNPDPCNIPDELRTTMRGKNVNPDDVNYQERFLLYSGQDGKLLVSVRIQRCRPCTTVRT